MSRFLLKSVSVLAFSIALAGCGDAEKSPKTQATAPIVPAMTAPATATPNAAAALINPTQVRAVAVHYADLAHAVFSETAKTAQALQAATEALLANPNVNTLHAAREAWKAARVFYMQSEVFRFGNPVVDEWEGRQNAWPLDEGLIDYVAADYQHALGNPGAMANIIANERIQVGAETLDASHITGELLASLNELAGSEANVATGYHAIEFLLWGQDLNGTAAGAGNRPATDFAQGDTCTGGHCARRAEYLRAVTALLVSDMQYMADQWKVGVEGNYRAALLAESNEQVLRKMLFGMGSLSLGELAGERLKVALEANSTEDEHDCFSDNTHNSHFYDEQGIRNVYLGEFLRSDGTRLTGPSLSSLVAALDPATDSALRTRLDTTRDRLQRIVDSAERDNVHFDQLIASGNTQGNQLVRDALLALVEQTAAIEQVANRLGITELNPDTADHKF